MADYVEMARRFLAEHGPPRPEMQIKPDPQAEPYPAQSAHASASLKPDSKPRESPEPTQEQIDAAGRILAQAGMRLMELGGVTTIGIWSDTAAIPERLGISKDEWEGSV